MGGLLSPITAHVLTQLPEDKSLSHNPRDHTQSTLFRPKSGLQAAVINCQKAPDTTLPTQGSGFCFLPLEQSHLLTFSISSNQDHCFTCQVSVGPSPSHCLMTETRSNQFYAPRSALLSIQILGTCCRQRIQRSVFRLEMPKTFSVASLSNASGAAWKVSGFLPLVTHGHDFETSLSPYF